jgi:hypothetical protein
MIESPDRQHLQRCHARNDRLGQAGQAGQQKKKKEQQSSLASPCSTLTVDAEVVIGVGWRLQPLSTMIARPLSRIARDRAMSERQQRLSPEQRNSARDHLGVREAGHRLQLLHHQSVRLGVNPAAHTLAPERNDTVSP